MLTRRNVLALGVGGAAAVLLPLPAFASNGIEDAILQFTGGVAPVEGAIRLTTPEIAENGNTVPVAVEADGAVAIALFAAGNPSPHLCKFNFGEAAGSHRAATRIRLGGTQDVVAVARLADGSFVTTRNEVKVTIGGCGG